MFNCLSILSILKIYPYATKFSSLLIRSRLKRYMIVLNNFFNRDETITTLLALANLYVTSILDIFLQYYFSYYQQ